VTVAAAVQPYHSNLDLPYAASTSMQTHYTIPDFASFADLASARVGGRAIASSDEFFASKSNLVEPEAPAFIAGKFTSRGKWMDGWETRRRRTEGHDWCVIALGHAWTSQRRER
jgi:allantoicase